MGCTTSSPGQGPGPGEGPWVAAPTLLQKAKAHKPRGLTPIAEDDIFCGESPTRSGTFREITSFEGDHTLRDAAKVTSAKDRKKGLGTLFYHYYPVL
mmetsp:Transcript_15838/g.25770  ORF Transcript_15838/g.25770 Transcript_15838/m.25770 type:complete len:97 (+) Transcript_15838:32-322(+)